MGKDQTATAGEHLSCMVSEKKDKFENKIPSRLHSKVLSCTSIPGLNLGKLFSTYPLIFIVL